MKRLIRQHSLCAIIAIVQAGLFAHAAQAQKTASSDQATVPQSPTVADPVSVPQDPSAAPSTVESASASDIIVTGSRLPSGFKTPTPVTIVSSDQLAQLSPSSAGEALARLPAFVGSQVTSKGGSSSQLLSGAQALLNLRGLGANRTLILLNGERLPATNVLGSVDTNVIPQALLQRIDVVTGGASSTYGSDAVAGVVNFILDTKFTGLKLDVNAGVTDYGDGGHQHVSLAAGHDFGGFRVIGSAEYYHQDGIGLPPTGREWFDKPAGLVTLPAGSATTFGIVPDVRFSNSTPGGLITGLTAVTGRTVGAAGTAALLFKQLGLGGAVLPYDRGQFTGTAFQSGGDGGVAVNGLSPTQERYGGYLRGEFKLSDTITAYVDGLYNRSKTNSVGTYSYQQTTRAFRIYADNPYLSADIRSILAANNIASFTLGRTGTELPILTVTDNSLVRATAGIQGSFANDWKFDVSATASKAKQDFAARHTINRNLYAAADAVVGPNDTIVCRSTLAGLDPGCVPINVLGLNTITQPGADYVSGFERGVTTDKQFTVSANLNGDFGEGLGLGAGPISFAVGAAFRRDDIERVVSPLADVFTSCTGLRAGGCDAYNNVYGGYQTYNPSPLKGRIDVTEGYAELGIPILKNLPFAKSIDLALAGRATHYSTSGMTYTWKIGPSWAISDEFRLRATRSQDIRAPTANDLFSTVSSSTNTSSTVYPSSAGGQNVTTVSLTVGNPNLKPEVAQTLTLGAVYQPSWLPGFSASVDYFDVKISDAIAAPVNQSVVNACFAGDQSFCNFISVGGNPVTTTTGIVPTTAGVVVRLAPINVATVKTSGLDIELGYRSMLAGGKLALRALGSYAFTYDNSALTAPAGPTLIGAYGLNQLAIPSGGGIPRWTATLTQDYELPLSGSSALLLGLTERLIAPGKVNPNYTDAQLSPEQNRVPQVTYVDAVIGFKFDMGGSDAAVTLNVLNLFDKDPPITPIATTFQAPTNFQIYDVLGRRFSVAFKMKW
ncbi:TonB-dependent receptor [Sphingomonas sp. QA11]|uniref:TonB-dependent receptor n=1 Tax=Sphingomonas sp. QA11 TaxID=2950605 RepID=UPI00234A5CDC|nr:TonB-dependent receptor [Sphingomonas sp. QA11]WCM25864.1 TonB-dependent receptor [Sphingomonas sp. QA11]